MANLIWKWMDVHVFQLWRQTHKVYIIALQLKNTVLKGVVFSAQPGNSNSCSSYMWKQYPLPKMKNCCDFSKSDILLQLIENIRMWKVRQTSKVASKYIVMLDCPNRFGWTLLHVSWCTLLYLMYTSYNMSCYCTLWYSGIEKYFS